MCVFVRACVCVEERVCLFAVGGGMGREGKVFLDVSFFHSKIRASPANKGRTRQTGRTADGAAARIRRVENKKIVYQL